MDTAELTDRLVCLISNKHMKQSLVRDKIVETASELFYQKGYNLTGINEIIKEAGIAKATLYNHFTTKSEICVAYLQDKNEKFLTDINDYATTKPPGRQQLLALFDFLNDFFNTDYFNGCWCINTVSEIPQKDAIIRDEVQLQKRLFLKLIEELTKTNYPNMDKAKAESLAKQIYLLYEGAISESNLHKQNWPIASARNLCEVLID